MKKDLGLYAGSFDPPTLGHFNLIARASKLFETLVVGIAKNDAKPSHFLSYEERLAVLRDEFGQSSNIRIEVFEGLTADFAASLGSTTLVRGLRTSGDLHFEMELAFANRCLSSKLETVFLPSDPQFAFMSSSLVRSAALSKEFDRLTCFTNDKAVSLIRKKLENP